MSKFLKVMIVLLTIAAVAAPAFAEDRLGLSGELRNWAWSKDNGTTTDTYVASRLRMGGKLTVAEGVSVNFRTDVTEATWGNGGNSFGAGRIPDGGTMQWDRAYVDLTQGNVFVRAGQQYAGFGLGYTINQEDTGVRVDYKGPVTISAFWFLSNQNKTAAKAAGFQVNQTTGVIEATPAVAAHDGADAYVWAIDAAHKTDMYKADIFFAGQTKEKNSGESVYLVGVDFSTKVAMAAIAAEADFFFGDATATADAVGTQLFVDASMAASEQATVGAQLYYALSADAGEVQYQFLGNDYNGYDPIMDIGTWLSNEQISYGRPFDFTGAGAGVMGGRLYGKFKASDSVNLGASFAYLTPEDDKLTTRDSDMLFAIGGMYQVMSNTSLQAQVQFISKDDSNNAVEDETQAGVALFVSF